MEQQWEEAEKILSWREMHPGVYRYHGIEHCRTNDYGRPISVVTLENQSRKEKQRQAYTGSQCGFCGCVALSEPSNYSFALTSMSFRDLPLL